MYQEHIENIQKLTAKVAAIRAKVAKEGRALNSEESGLIGEMLVCIDDERRYLPEKALTLQNSIGGAPRQSFGPNGGFELKKPGQAKDYNSLFGNRGGGEWSDHDTNFFSAVFSGRHHPGLITNSMAESIPADGGFLIPSETAAKIHAVSLESEIIMPRCYLQPMISNEISIPAMSIGSHGACLFGGFVASYASEAGTINEANPKARSMTLTTQKLTGLIRFSSELSADTVGGFNQIVQICGKGLAWYRDKAFISGDGASQPLGVLNSPCKVVVPKQNGQKKATIVYENLIDMMSRMYAGSFSNSIWLCSQDCIPQLLSLSIAIGFGGAVVPVMSESNGEFKILTRPVLFTEKVPALGSEGDISLLDLSTYCVGLRAGMRFDTSIHVAFATDELLSRIIERHCGQSLWNEPLTLATGQTVSPVVVLAVRA